jgi:hypothetical protein
VEEWAVNDNIKKNPWISWIHPMHVLAAYGSSDSGYRVTQMAKQKKQYNNTKFIQLITALPIYSPQLPANSPIQLATDPLIY